METLITGLGLSGLRFIWSLLGSLKQLFSSVRRREGIPLADLMGPLVCRQQDNVRTPLPVPYCTVGGV